MLHTLNLKKEATIAYTSFPFTVDNPSILYCVSITQEVGTESLNKHDRKYTVSSVILGFRHGVNEMFNRLGS
jgi:hypothetical protein